MFEQEPKIYFYKGLSQYYPEENMRREIERIILNGQTDSFHITDLDSAGKQLERWKTHLSWIEPHYAIKANSSPHLMEFYNSHGVNFDVASKREMELCQNIGVGAERVVYSNPCKMERDLEFAQHYGVELTVFDSISELHKIAKVYPGINLLLRIKAIDGDAQVQFSHRFGVGPDEWTEMLQEAKRLGFEVRGVSFHVGSGAAGGRSAVFARALQDARDVFDLARGMGFQHMDTVNVGGGFGAEESLDDMGAVLSKMRPLFPHARWIAEPGRFLAASTQVSAARVMLTKPGQVTINDGMYGTFSCIPFDHMLVPDSHPIDVTGCPAAAASPYYVFGPSCDGYDIVSGSLPVPSTIAVNDWLVFAGVGAYTQASASEFNGVRRSEEIVRPCQKTQVFDSIPWSLHVPSPTQTGVLSSH